MYEPLVCAYMGDVIYEKYVREHLIKMGISKVGELQNKSLEYVSANSQRKHLERLLDSSYFTDKEIDIIKWGRNAKGTKSKSTDIITYRLATGLETLIGKLYFDKKYDRIEEIMKNILGE